MSRNRRRACQFEFSVNSLQDSRSSAELNSEHQQTILDDSFNTISHIPCKGNASVPDLNERIALSPTENLKGYTARDLKTRSLHIVGKDYDRGKENETSQCSVKNVQPVINANDTFELKKKSFPNVNITKDSSRDTNFNIEQSTNEKCTNSSKERYDSIGDNSQKFNSGIVMHSELNEEATEQYHKFENMLCFLDNQLNQIEEACQPQQIFKRLSNNFNISPTNFTERLLTIIEESVAHDDTNMAESGVNLSRLTTEFKKMCKFIEDETAPEWPPSPLSTPPCPNQTKTNINTISSAESTKLAHEKSILSMSIVKSPFKKVYSSYKEHLKSRKLQHRLSKSLLSSSMDNLTNVSLNQTYNDSFERLEAQCNKLFKTTMESPKPLYKAVSLPLLRSMESIHKISEEQMASLNTTNALVTESEHLNEESNINTNKKGSQNQSIGVSCYQDSLTSDSTLRDLEQEQQYVLEGNKNEGTMRENFQSMNLEELETTIMQDLAEKRKRCLDTVKLLIDINADPQKGQPQSPTPNGEAKFVNTLVTCKNYYTHLKKQKPFFNFLRSELSTMEVSDQEPVKGCLTPMSVGCNSNKSPSLQKGMKGTSKDEGLQKKFFVSPATSPTSKPYLSSRKKSASKEARPNSHKRKFFPTPGKNAPTTPSRRKQVFFPNMHNELKKTPECILKSPNAKGLYRLNYNTVVSPVGMYIRGTDTQLLKNVQGKTDKFLLEPAKRKNQMSPSFLTVQHQVQKVSKTSPGINSTPTSSMHPGYRINGCRTPTSTGNEYVLPKVTYKLPAQTHTVKDNEVKDTRQHIRTLLQSTRSKVVIHHRGRIHSEKKNGQSIKNSDGDVINHNSEDESIHIVQAASKSNCFQKRLYM